MNGEWSSAGVALPHQVAAALESDRLVFFCGAGVSIPDPSNLPSFLGLAREIALSIDPSTDVNEIDHHTQLDVLLGRLDEEHGNVHLRVQLLVESSTLPNELHASIAKISGSKTARIVTTNFDLHLEKVIGKEVPVYAAPALPLGDDFHGLVHLHGRIPIATAERLVVTDRDFGRAYITEGWTTEFLTRLFAGYCVVFVGYSAQDTVIRYLARALPEGGQLFALTPESESDNWGPLRVAPITYPQPKGDQDHEALASFLTAWAESVVATPEDKYDKVESLYKVGPGSSRFSDDECLWMLRDPQMSVQFMTFSTTTEWVAWVGEHQVEPRMFDTLEAGDDHVGLWSGWLARAVEHDAKSVVKLLAINGGRLSSGLWVRLVIALNDSFSPGLDHSQLAMMLMAATPVREPGRMSMLLATISKRDPATAELLMHQLLAVDRTFRWQAGFAGDGARMSFLPLWDDYSMREVWGELGSQLAEPGRLIESLLDLLGDLEAADSIFAGRLGADLISRMRPAIAEEAVTDRPMILLVEMLRDLLVQEVTDQGVGRTARLLSRRSEAVRRVALFALGSSRSDDANEVLHLLVDRTLLFDPRLRAEAFHTLATVYSSADQVARNELVDHVTSYVDPEDSRRPTDDLRYNLLEWTARRTTDDEVLNGALRALQARHPNLQPNEHADRTFWTTVGSGFVETPSATGRFDHVGLEDLLDSLAGDSSIADFMDGRETFAEVHRFIERGGATLPELLRALRRRELWASSLWSYLVDSPPMTADLSSVVNECLHHPNLGEIVWALSRFVGSDYQQREGETVTKLRRRLDAAFKVWRRLSKGPSHSADPMTLTVAVNSPEGQIASVFMEIWQQLAFRRDRRAFTKTELVALTEMVDSADNPADATIVILTRFTGNLDFFDSDWFERVLLPRFDRSGASADRAWMGLIGGFGWTSHLRDVLGEAVKSGLAWMRQHLPTTFDDFLELHSWMFLFARAAPSWPDNAFIQATEAERAQWIRDVGYHVNRNPKPGDVDHLLEYWTYRSSGMPLPISAREQQAFLGWLRLDDIDFDSFAELFVAGPLVEQATDSYFFFDYEALPWVTHPTSTGRVVLHLIKSGPRLPPSVRSISEHAVSLAPADPPLARELLSELLARGFTPARQLLADLAVP